MISKGPGVPGFFCPPQPGTSHPCKDRYRCHVRSYAGSDTAGAWHNTATEVRHIGLVRFHAGLGPAFAGLNAGAQCLDIAGARLARLLRRGGRT